MSRHLFTEPRKETAPHLNLLSCYQVWNAQDAEDECLVMAVRTGMNTGLGRMVRELVCPSRLSAQTSPFVKVRPAALGLLSRHCRSPQQHHKDASVPEMADLSAPDCINTGIWSTWRFTGLLGTHTKAVHAGCLPPVCLCPGHTGMHLHCVHHYGAAFPALLGQHYKAGVEHSSACCPSWPACLLAGGRRCLSKVPSPAHPIPRLLPALLMPVPLLPLRLPIMSPPVPTPPPSASPHVWQPLR